MTIEKRNVKEERFYAWQLTVTAALMTVLYLLIHSAVFFELLAAGTLKKHVSLSAEQLHRILRYGRDAVWGYGLVLAMTAVFHRTKDQLKTGLLIVLGFEALLLLTGILFLTQTAMDPAVYGAVLCGNLLAAFVVLIHERVLL